MRGERKRKKRRGCEVRVFMCYVLGMGQIASRLGGGKLQSFITVNVRSILHSPHTLCFQAKIIQEASSWIIQEPKIKFYNDCSPAEQLSLLRICFVRMTKLSRLNGRE
jgi:hypothetical protein